MKENIQIFTLWYRIKFLLWSHLQGDKFDLQLPVLQKSAFYRCATIEKVVQCSWSFYIPCKWALTVLPERFKLSALCLQKSKGKKYLKLAKNTHIFPLKLRAPSLKFLRHADLIFRSEDVKVAKNEQKLTIIDHTNTFAPRNLSKYCQIKFFFECPEK